MPKLQLKTSAAEDYDDVVRRFTLNVVEPAPLEFDFSVAYTDISNFIAGGLGYGAAFLGWEGLYHYSTKNTTGVLGTRGVYMCGMHQFFASEELLEGPAVNTISWHIYSHATTPIQANLQINLGMMAPGHFCLSPESTLPVGVGGQVFAVNGNVIDIAPGQIEFNTNNINISFELFDLGTITLDPGINVITYRRGDNGWDPEGPTSPAVDIIRITTPNVNLSWAEGFPSMSALISGGFIS